MFVVVHPKGLVAKRAGDGIAFLDESEVRGLGLDPADAYPLDERHRTIPFEKRVEPPFELMNLRLLAAVVDASLFGIVGRAMHTCDWLATSRFCGKCGTATKRHESERSTVCPSCGHHTYPRISPAIITLVRKGDLALLASNAKFPAAFYSTLAGFADIGESLEETLVREVREEVGIVVKDVRYFGSQPWPFPNSLMIAFTAEWESGEIVVDKVELSDAQWFRADALPMIPPPMSIARRLIDAWVSEVYPSRVG